MLCYTYSGDKMTDKRIDYLPHTGIKLYQRDDMFKINTDTQLLGNFIKMAKNATVLDIGCNNGALMLYCQKFQPARMTGVEILHEACELAETNMKLNDISEYQIINDDINNIVIDQVDVIIANPPYDKKNAILNAENKFLQTAKYEHYLVLDDLISKVKQLLKDNGHFFMIHRANRLNEIMYLLKINGMAADSLKFIYAKQKKDANVVLISAVKNKNIECKIYYQVLGDN